MTKTQAKQIVKDLGLRLTWSSEYQEYTVHTMDCTKDHARCYFTNDLADALATAQNAFTSTQEKEYQRALSHDITTRYARLGYKPNDEGNI